MPNTRWVNQTQPQTLVIATIVMYVNAVFGVLFGRIFTYGGSALFYLLNLVLILGPVAAGLGIANEKKWGYWAGVVLTVFEVVFLIRYFYAGNVITLLFYVALAALLLHPMSRSYYKTWFR